MIKRGQWKETSDRRLEDEYRRKNIRRLENRWNKKNRGKYWN